MAWFQWFLTGSDFSPRGYLVMPGDIVNCHKCVCVVFVGGVILAASE